MLRVTTVSRRWIDSAVSSEVCYFQFQYLIFMPFKVISVTAQETTEPFIPLSWFVMVDFMVLYEFEGMKP